MGPSARSIRQLLGVISPQWALRSAPYKSKLSHADHEHCAGSNSSSSQASDQTQLNGAVTSKPQKGAPAKGKKEEARPVDLTLLNLKVGVIRKAERHPDADTLYVEEVDCGEEQPRTVQPSRLPLSVHRDDYWMHAHMSLSCRGH